MQQPADLKLARSLENFLIDFESENGSPLEGRKQNTIKPSGVVEGGGANITRVKLISRAVSTKNGRATHFLTLITLAQRRANWCREVTPCGRLVCR